MGDKPVFRLKVEPAVPETSNKIRLTPRELVFDVKTGLLLKIVHDGKVVELEDYREVEGMLVPFRYIVTYNLGVIYSKSKITSNSIEFNVKLDEDLLSLDCDVDD